MSLYSYTPPIVSADPGDWGHMDGWGWGMGVFGWLFMALIVVSVAWMIWSTTRAGDRRTSPGSTALEVLDERFARGEIDREEYLRRKEDLRR
ncbi:MAG: SHOCT domain-containing protein [Actinobacteria bacterium]|nr:SHOCT domain-containing protein [Actinomycetota bacterium]MBU1493888.1 SHOCT domain-containing protein [Actinomycetota bacterium]MBU1865364.1 SHOCT domain-containing protein [Actinomycetota bacterium]